MPTLQRLSTTVDNPNKIIDTIILYNFYTLLNAAMIPIIDKLIISSFKSVLHKQRDALIDKALKRFKKLYPNATEAQEIAVLDKLEHEALRIYPIVDAAILKATILRARYTFWFIALFGTLLIGIYGGFSSGNSLNYFSPLIMALLTWFIACATSPILYNQRVKGALHSGTVIVASENSLVSEKEYLPAVFTKHCQLPKQTSGLSFFLKASNHHTRDNYGTFENPQRLDV